MKHSTFSAQGANNLLNVLQGYTKTIRLLLVMFLTLTVTTNAWGADVTLSSSTITSNKKLAYASEWTYTANNVSWSGYCYTDVNSKPWIQLKKDKGVYVKIVTPSGSKITQLKVTITSASNSSGGVADITKHTDFSGRVALLTEDADGSTSMTGVAYTTTVSNDIATLNPSGNNNTLYLKVSGRARIWSMTVTYETAAASCTPITPSLSYTPSSLSVGGTANPTLTGNSGNGSVTYSSSNTSVATVNTSTGIVTAKAAGTTTITATIAANNGYCEGTATANVTVTADPYTVTLNAGSGTCDDESLTETSGGAGVTLPTANPPATCATDGWEFAGWWTEAVTETTTSPGALLNAGSNYKPASDCTLHAVYSKTEGGEGEELSQTLQYDTWSYSGSTTNKSSYRMFHSYSYIESASFDLSKLSKVVVYGGTFGGNSYNKLTIGDGTNVWKEVTVSGNSETGVNTYTDGNTLSGNGNLRITSNSGTASGSGVRISKIEIYTTSATTTYNSNPVCQTCENSLTISKGTETNGTFTLSQSGNVETCDGDVEVVVTPTPAEHYSVSEVTATTPTTGGAPTVTNNGNDTWTVTYAQNSTGESTINVDFVEDARASITLSELGVEETDNTTYYVGAQYTLPTTSSQSCAGKQLVGWSTVEVAEIDTKPTENYYDLGAKVTLAATQTFYAVFAAGSGGGGETYTKVTTISDGTYLIAASKDEKTSYAYTGVVNGKTYGGYTDVTITDDKITTKPNNALEITVKVSDNNFSMYDGTNYLCLTSDGNNLNFNNSSEKIEWTLSNGKIQNTNYKTRYLQFNASSGSERFACYKSTQKDAYLYKKTTAVYTAYSTSCIPTYSITYDFAGGTSSHCSNTSVPQGDQYIICDEAPTREGYTFQGWSDGTNTHAAGATITPTKNITLTAVWQINTYTVTWSNNGTPTPVEYNHGDALEVPDAPASCDGVKEFVGWTTHSSYYHATTAPTDLFKTTTATVTADKTYYAVFATPGAGGTEFVLGESGTFKMYANVNGTNYYAQGGVNSSKITSTIEAANASDYTLTYADGSYTIKQGTSTIGHSSNADLSTTASTWTISAGTNGSWRVTSNVITSRALSYSTSAKAFKAYATSNITEGNETYFDIEFGSGSSGYSDYTTTCQQVESIEVQNNPKTEFYLTDDFTIGTGKVIATLSGGGTTDVTALATFSGYNMNVVGTYTVTVTYMGATATYYINVNPLDNAWVLTWNVSGKTNTGLGPRSVTKNSAIGALPTPEVPAACAGKTFMGWTTSNIVNSDGTGITYITSETVPTDNTTYYAVFATINNFCTQQPIDQIASGSKVVIVAVASLTNDGGAGKAISSRATDDTHNLQGDDVAIYDQTINTPHSTCIWTITKSGEKYIFKQDGQYLNGSIDNTYSNLKCNGTSDSWTLTPAESGMERTYNMKSTNASTEYVEWYNEKFTIHNEVNANGAFDMQFFVTANAAGNADTTDYTTGCAEYTITYYGFHGGYSTSCSSDGTIVLPVNSIHTIPNCEGLVINDHTNLGRTFTGVWMTKPHGGHTFNPGDTFILTQDTTLYAQWKMETTSDVTTLPTDIEDLAGTDIYVYGGKTLTLQPGTTTINSLTLKGGLQADGSYKMPTVWVPEGATLVRKSNKIYLDLVVNAQTYYPFAVPFAAKNNANVEYLDPELAAASTYGKHFVIKTYDGANRAKVGEDKTNNWVSVRRDSTLQPGVGYIITALTRSTKDTATIRIPMTVPDTWFNNGEQAAVGTTVRNTIAVTAHTGAAATKHPRHAGWNFVANPYLTNFTGGNVANDGGLDYINGELIIEGSYEYGGEDVPYVTIPAYNFASYSQHKLSDVKLSPEYSFFVQVGHGGTMNFTTAGRQQAPASIAARNAEERPVKMDVDLILSDNHSSDQTGIIICDRYSDAYEIGHDLEKLFGSAYNLSVYTLMADNTPLAFQALAIRSSMQVIPVGYRAPEQGEYTFRLNEATSSIDLLNEQYEQLVLVDYQTGELTNLLYTDYTFYSERTQSNSRFAIYAVPRQNAPTDLPNAIGSDEEVRKVIYNDHLYILRDGNVYNGMGQKM